MFTSMFIFGILLFSLLRECKPDDDDCLYNCYTITDISGRHQYLFSQVCEKIEPLVTMFRFDLFQKKVRAANEKLSYQAVRLHKEECQTTMGKLVQSIEQKISTLSKPQNIPANHSSVDLKMEFFIGTAIGFYTWSLKMKKWVQVHSPMYNMVPDPSHHRLFCADLESVWSVDVKTLRCEKVWHDTKDTTISIGLDAHLEQLFLCVYSGLFYRIGVKEDSKLYRLPSQGRMRSFIIEPYTRWIYASLRGKSHEMFVLTYQGKMIGIHRITQDMTRILSIDLNEMRIIYKTKRGLFEFSPRGNRSSKCVLPPHDRLIQIQYEPKLIATLQQNGRISVYDRNWRKIVDIYNPHAFGNAVDFAMIQK